MSDLLLTWPADGGFFTPSPEMREFLWSFQHLSNTLCSVIMSEMTEEPYPFVCTRNVGHTGLHMAASTIELCALWDDMGHYQLLFDPKWNEVERDLTW